MSGRFFRTAPTEEVIRKMVVKATVERKLIEEGDRILIGCSGGKDSTVLAWALSSIRPALKINYELAAIHIASDFDGCSAESVLASRIRGWDIPFTELFVPVVGRLKEGRKMNCYWCSTQRRTELLNYAMEHGFNKIALGHHLDDILETFMMNMMNKGELLAMPIRLKYSKYPVSLIRPLAYLEERQIIEYADETGILKTACTCPYGIKSARRDVRNRIRDLTDGSGAAKRRMLEALSSGAKDLLVEE
jgi:tRNA 2-thiocytidine biosynthesis protein TtcA